jgi:hypothetical protein
MLTDLVAEYGNAAAERRPMRPSWHSYPTVRLASRAPASYGALVAGSSQAAAAHHLGAALLLDVLAGIGGALLTTAFDGSPTARLIGTVVGIVVATLLPSLDRSCTCGSPRQSVSPSWR